MELFVAMAVVHGPPQRQARIGGKPSRAGFSKSSIKVTGP
jgi:hypothetical protein